MASEAVSMADAASHPRQAKRKRPRCPYCGRPYQHAGECCARCERIFRDANYNPAWDKAYLTKVAAALVEQVGCWVPHLAKVVGGTAHDVEAAVRVLRRRGFDIDSRRPTGYRLSGFFGHPFAGVDE
jgi:hypothetical protein